jgi:hypothetical protein
MHAFIHRINTGNSDNVVLHKKGVMTKRTLKICFQFCCIFLLFTACNQIVTTDPVSITQSYSQATPTDAAAEPQSFSQALTDGVQEVGGIVLDGGDSTSAGLMDAPRTFIYRVKLDSGEEINISYTSYPASPAGDSRPKVKLAFYAGEILVGDYLVARGTYDSSNQTLTVAAEGDYIETFEKKP